MVRAIIIIHPSEIIRKGLFTVLENEIVSTIFCFEGIEEVTEQLFVTYTEILFVLPINDEQNELFRQLRNKPNRTIFIGVDSVNSGIWQQHFDFVFNINKPAKELVRHINKHFAETGTNSNDDELTIREKDVLRLIALGQTNKSIAETLFISTHTVVSHRKNITNKLGIKSIPGLTVYAIIQKIISQADIANSELN
jgi:DNA-binding CsgD family transcriptional regulator